MASKNRSSEKEAFWRLVFEEFAASGLSVRAYCLQEGLSEPSFYAWRKTIRNRDADGHKSAADEQALVPVDIVDRVETDSPGCDEASRPPLLEVITPSGFTFRFPQEIQLQHFDALLSVIAHSGGAASC